jgi:protein N-terminal amidase
MKLCVVQFNPLKGQIQSNISTAELLLDGAGQSEFGFIILPEMCFTGYCFRSKKEIEPFVEEIDGVSVSFGIKIAKKYQSWVQLGFPRVEQQGNYYNSIAFISPQGKVEKVYDKHFLYTQDEFWASEGVGFETTWTQFGKVGHGICIPNNSKALSNCSNLELIILNKRLIFCCFP